MMYITLVNKYFNYLNSNYEDDDEFRCKRYSMEELLRASLCYGLGLKSIGATERVEVESRKCANYIFEGVNTKKWNDNYKQGILEACVKCVSMACDKVDEKEVSHVKLS